MRVLGIETSCDETAAAVVARDDGSGCGRILASVVHSQTADHAPYGGVVPEIAARAHVVILDRLIRQALEKAGTELQDIDAVAATAGPGLVGGLIVGLMTAKAIALAADRPFIAVNHLEGHALTAQLIGRMPFPYLLLLVSGGHTQILLVRDVGNYERLGTTIDDALGEAFDKTAKLLGLPYPGGPAVEQAASSGDPGRIALPRPLMGDERPDFSFSGLKTAVRQAALALAPLRQQDVADICAAFQAAVTDTLADRVERCLIRFQAAFPDMQTPALVVAGGVAANTRIRQSLAELCGTHGFRFVAPPAELCTDNAAMIAWAGAERRARGDISSLDAPPRARWLLDGKTAPRTGDRSKGART